MKRGSMFVYPMVALLLVLSASLVLTDDVSAGGPDLVADNPTCGDLGYDYGFKVENGIAGVYAIDGWHHVTITTTDNTYVDWWSDLGIDAVIVKGGPNANVYEYDPEAFGDTGLHPPINPSTGQPYGLSHVDFCYDYEVEVTKTADTTFTRTYEWDITKSVSPATWHMFLGDTATSEYTVEVTKTGYTDSNWAVSGTITIFNPAPMAATITGVDDSLTGFGAAVVSCPVTFPYDLASGGTLECTYSTTLPDGTSRTNVATVTTSGAVGGGQGSSAVDFVEPTTEVNASVDVNDSNGYSWVFTGSGSRTYDKTFSCPTLDDYSSNNTAMIVQTGQSDSATVNVHCYSLNVTKDAQTAFTRTYNWTIDKSADHAALTLSTGQQHLVNYSINVPQPSLTDSEWTVTGNITIHNPAPIPATILDVRDYLDGTEAEVTCPAWTPIPAGGTRTCTYTYAAPDDDTLTNIAEVTLRNHHYWNGSQTPVNGTTIFSSAGVPVVFGEPTTVIDECIDVSDTYLGSLGSVCVGDAPWAYTYSRDIGPYSICGSYTVDNTASFVTNDTGSIGSDAWTVAISVPCAGCTLTQGYWKTHSIFGPAPYDDTWAGKEDDLFFNSGLMWYYVLWTTPKNGDAYYILAHQYIAAVLNQANGAYVPPSAVDAMLYAASLLNDFVPGTKGRGHAAIRAEFLETASILASYNEGLIGPGHCSE